MTLQEFLKLTAEVPRRQIRLPQLLTRRCCDWSTSSSGDRSQIRPALNLNRPTHRSRPQAG